MCHCWWTLIPWGERTLTNGQHGQSKTWQGHLQIVNMDKVRHGNSCAAIHCTTSMFSETNKLLISDEGLWFDEKKSKSKDLHLLTQQRSFTRSQESYNPDSLYMRLE